ncbi:MAG: MFS transporter [Deltaproteobacteria bacterium]|jgi:predicted MFS family arabinose efflux permease
MTRMPRTDFGRLWMAQSVSALGSRVTRTALPVLAILSVDGTPLELGILAAVSTGPGAIVALLAAGRIDRAQKRSVLIGADLVRAVLILTLPLAAWLGALTMLQLYGVAALVGTASALFAVTDNAYLVHLVPAEELVDKNAKLETTESIAEIVGPGFAGLLIEWVTAPMAMLLDAISYVWSAVLLFRIQTREPELPTTTPHLWTDLREGFDAVWSEPRVRPYLIVTAIQTLADSFFFALYMLFTLETLALSVGAVGVIISMGGFGALFGALLSRRITSRGGLIAAFTVSQLSMIFIPLAAVGGWWAIGLLVAHQLVSDGFEIAYQVHATTHRQTYLDRSVLARANGIFTAVETLLLPVAALGAGAVAEAIGIGNALYLGVTFALVSPLPLLALPKWVASRSQ